MIIRMIIIITAMVIIMVFSIIYMTLMMIVVMTLIDVWTFLMILVMKVIVYALPPNKRNPYIWKVCYYVYLINCSTHKY